MSPLDSLGSLIMVSLAGATIASQPADPRAPDPEATRAPVFDGDAREPSQEPVTTPPDTPPATAPSPSPPPMPEVEELPAKEGSRRPLIDLGPPDRGPAGTEGGSFFDPGKLADSGPGGGMVQIRGFLGAGFFVAQRTNTRVRDDDGAFERLDPQPFFGAGSATLYVGAPIYADVVYARLAFEYLSIPKIDNTGGNEDVLVPARRELLVESVALEVNPFAWAKRAGRWFREGFKITGGVFLVPFGLEDEDHAAPARWFVSRPRSMTVGRVYPGTWSDVGVYLTWKPTFRDVKPIRPIELDVGVVNGDPCTQTRFADTLYQPTGLAAPCERSLRVDEGGAAEGPAAERADTGFLGVGLDNNRNKSVVARMQLFPLPAFNFGGSFVWGKHPRIPTTEEKLAGKTTVDVSQAPSWRAGAHLDLDLDQMLDSKFPLPAVRGELVYGVDEAPAPAAEATATGTDRRVLGGYVQVAQPLFRRKRSRLPGLIVQYRYDHADPDLDVPGTKDGVPLRSDFSDPFLYDETIATHTVGLRLPVVPRFSLRADYGFALEDGGRENQLYNDVFGLQAVVDF